ncbi:ATP-dependent Clp protease ATP-binding subunit ClpB [Pancytospora philotis]|nr:ATP-dependent Clp protease ATP-binding subunit ClpB [Pancytospora philotis]
MVKLTNRAQKAFEEANSMASSMRHTTLETEHLLRAILKEKSVLNKVLSAEELAQLGRALDAALASFARLSQPVPQAQPSHALSTVINSAVKSAKDATSVTRLLKYLLEDRAVARHLSGCGAKPELLGSRIEEELAKETGSMETDDPEDKMSQFAVDMVEQARKNRFDPVIGRDDEIRQVLEILAKKTKSNVLMVGKPGVGKTAIVNGIAQMIARDDAHLLEGHRIYNVDIGSMVAGSSLRGEFEERLKGLVKEAEDNPKVILFIDEIHVILGAGKADGSLDAANILKPGLADGSLRVIGATTYDEYRKYVTKDPAFERRFTRVNVREPSIEDTITIMRGLRERLEMHHGVKIADRALVYASQMSKRYIPNRRLPDIAIDLVDTACASAIISLNSEPAEITTLKKKIWSLVLEKTSIEMDIKRLSDAQPAGQSARPESDLGELRSALALNEQRIGSLNAELKALEAQFDADKGHVREARELKQKIEDAKNLVEQARKDGNRYHVYDLQTNIIPAYEKKLAECNDKVEVIDIGHVVQVISRLSGIPVSRLDMRENERLLGMEGRIKQKIFGQDDAVRLVVESIMSSRVGLGSENRPIGSFLFLGPTGVGKTELSKAICQELNGTCSNMVVLDMSDYASELSLNKLIGAAAGYVGCEEGGSLTEPVKEMPYTVVLLDELDLAHQSVINVLYQLLDEGRVTDGRGVQVSFKDTVVVMTSNLGQEFIHPDGPKGSYVEMNQIEALILRRFGHALVNRIDHVIPFHHLAPAAMNDILSSEVAVLNKKLTDKHLVFELSDGVRQHAIDSTTGSGYGARILKRFVRDYFVGPLTKIILQKRTAGPATVHCFLNEEEGIDGQSYGPFTFVCTETQPAAAAG